MENEDVFKICGVAKVRPRKGFMRLAEAHKRLQDEGYKYHIYILGEGEEQERFKAIWIKIRLQILLHFLDMIRIHINMLQDVIGLSVHLLKKDLVRQRQKL